jgi:hypothetical protein
MALTCNTPAVSIGRSWLKRSSMQPPHTKRVLCEGRACEQARCLMPGACLSGQ